MDKITKLTKKESVAVSGGLATNRISVIGSILGMIAILSCFGGFASAYINTSENNFSFNKQNTSLKFVFVFSLGFVAAKTLSLFVALLKPKI